MADLSVELAELNANARELLKKHDGVFTKLEELSTQKQTEIEKIITTKQKEIDTKVQEGLKAIDDILKSGRVAEAENALKLGGKKLLATVNADGSFNDDGIFKIKNVNGVKTLVGILDTQLSAIPTATPFDIFGDGSRIALFEFEGNTNDAGGVYNVTETNNIDYCDGVIGKAINYYSKDASAYIKTPIIRRNDSKEITISGWIKVYGHTGQWVSIWHLTPDGGNDNSNSRQPALWMYSGDNTKFHIRNDGVSTRNLGIDVSQGSIQYGQWHHIVQVVTLRQIKFYIDGVLTDTYNSSEDFKFNDGVFYIGDPWYIKNHAIDHVSIINRALTDEEIQKLYNEGR